MKKSLILSLACLMTLCAMAQVQLREDEVTAVKFVQNETTDWYMLADNPEVTFIDHNPAIKDKTYDLANGDVTTTFGVPVAPIDEWVTLRTDVTAGNWNTICVEHNITAIDGATFWNVVSETEKEFILEQVSAPFAAGVGYIIQYTKSEVKVMYEGGAVEEPVAATSEHPIQGNFEEITCDEQGSNELVGNYVVYQNELHKVTGWVTMEEHHAYVIADFAPNAAPAPKGPRMTMPKPNNTPTGFGQWSKDKGQKTMKVIENGQFRIVRDNKMYNAQGIIIK